jgi:hypothetical protein
MCLGEKKCKVKTVKTRAYAIPLPPSQHVSCGMALHPNVSYGAATNNLVNNVPHPYPNSMVARYPQKMEGSNPPPAVPFLPGAASSPPPAISANLCYGAQHAVVSELIVCPTHYPTSLTQTQSVLPTSITPSITRTPPLPLVVPRQGLILATNLNHASPSLNKPSAATEATISPCNTYTVSPVMDPLTLKMNMDNEHAKASAAATAAPAAEVEVGVGIVPKVVTEAPAGAALPRPHKRRPLPEINQVGTQPIEENIAKATAQQKESELALATQKAEL